jgi:DNA-binding response OmpR family regulator
MTVIQQDSISEFLQPVKVSIARDGKRSLCSLTNASNMIILDLSLPVLSGYDVLERNPRKDIPIVIFSATMQTSDVERTLSLGAKEYVHKPMDMVGYRNAVLGMVRNWAIPQQDAIGAVTE